jgi:hypothetical protein
MSHIPTLTPKKKIFISIIFFGLGTGKGGGDYKVTFIKGILFIDYEVTFFKGILFLDYEVTKIKGILFFDYELTNIKGPMGVYN